jgi:hypothetical protein
MDQCFSTGNLSGCAKCLSCAVTGRTNKINQMAKGIYYYRFNAFTSVTDNDCYLWLCFCIYTTYLQKNYLILLALLSFHKFCEE